MTKYIIFLDYRKYPNHKAITNILTENDSNAELINTALEDPTEINELFANLEVDKLDKSDEVKLFSLYPDELKLTYDSIQEKYIKHVVPHFKLVNKGIFNKHVMELKNLNSHLVVPRIKLSQEVPADPLEVSKLFELSPSKSIKYQCKGSVTQILEYRGLESFLYLENLTEGLLTPATQHEWEVVYTDTEKVSGDMVVQFINESISDHAPRMYHITKEENEKTGFVWYESYPSEVPELFLDLNIPEGMDYNFYIYVKELDGLYISSVARGIHPFADINYL